MRLPTLLNQCLTAMMILDNNFTIIEVNTATEQLFLASRGQLLRSRIFDLLIPVSHSHLHDIESANFYQALTEQLQHIQVSQQTFIRYDVLIGGMYQPILVDYAITAIADGERDTFLIELWHKDSQAKIQQQQQQHDQHHVTRSVIRNLAHEIKNPLAGIYGASQLLQKNLQRLGSPPAQTNAYHEPSLSKLYQYIDVVMSETQRLNTLVNQLLGTPTLPHWGNLNIHEPIEHVLKLVTLENMSSQSIVFIRDYDFSLPDIMADKNALIQVFLNLINNALQSLIENPVPEPCISVRTRIAYQQTIGEVRHKSSVMVDVMDNGIGIAPTLLPQIFYPMVTGRATGTGLGLALVQDIIERHHGLISVTSRQGKTQFSLCLPFKVNVKVTDSRSNTGS